MKINKKTNKKNQRKKQRKTNKKYQFLNDHKYKLKFKSKNFWKKNYLNKRENNKNLKPKLEAHIYKHRQNMNYLRTIKEIKELKSNILSISIK